MSGDSARNQYPAALIEWAGHHSGGVRRLFDDGSGRPSRAVVKTNLLARLERWASDFAVDKPGTPRIVLLVGGPGNGKTEAVESTIHWLDEALMSNGHIVRELTSAFSPKEGQPVPRIVRIAVGHPGPGPRDCTLRIVQDASVFDPLQPGKSRAQLLIEELDESVQSSQGHAYLCCVNRGVLDDALIHTIEYQLGDARLLLETITRSVSLSPDAPSCWPLDNFPAVAIWPMDAESLLVPTDSGAQSPASNLLEHATDASRWPSAGTCSAGMKCPFCQSRALLSADPHRSSLLQMLRWYELGSGKRWTFRDLFSLISYLLAGNNFSGAEVAAGPCGWAARLVELDLRSTGLRPEKERSTAIFYLVAASYQHALFGRWDSSVARQLRIDTKDLGLEHDHVLSGLYNFLRIDRAAFIPATIAPLLEGLVDVLDPALADPDAEVRVSARTSVLLRDIDARFSQSVGEGLSFIRRYHCLSAIEVELLERLAKVDGDLTASEVRRRRPAAANRIQRLLRDFSCRLVRRSLGAREAVDAVHARGGRQEFQLRARPVEAQERLRRRPGPRRREHVAHPILARHAQTVDAVEILERDRRTQILVLRVRRPGRAAVLRHPQHGLLQPRAAQVHGRVLHRDGHRGGRRGPQDSEVRRQAVDRERLVRRVRPDVSGQVPDRDAQAEVLAARRPDVIGQSAALSGPLSFTNRERSQPSTYSIAK